MTPIGAIGVIVFGTLYVKKRRNAKSITIARFGNVDILVNSYNLEWGKPATKMAVEEWDRVIDANLRAVFISCRVVGRRMIAVGEGSIVNIASALGSLGVINMSAYCASMGGVFALTRALALEWAPNGVRVNTIGVGWMEKETEIDAEDRAEAILRRYIPAGHRCQPEEIMPLTAFLASPSASYISGHVYFVDGGLSARA